MNIIQSVGLAAVLTAGLVVPTLASADQPASIHLYSSNAREMIYSAFAGPVDAVRLGAQNSAISCEYVEATYSNGFSEKVFSGVLRTDAPVDIPLAGYRRNISRLAFSCRSESLDGGALTISASNVS
jgi:hypothetical protein